MNPWTIVAIVWAAPSVLIGGYAWLLQRRNSRERPKCALLQPKYGA